MFKNAVAPEERATMEEELADKKKKLQEKFAAQRTQTSREYDRDDSESFHDGREQFKEP